MEPVRAFARQEEPLRLRVTDNGPDGTAVVRVHGEISAATCRSLDYFLRLRLPSGSTHVILELSETTLLAAAGVTVLLGHARRLAAAGRTLSLAAPSAHVRNILHVTGAVQVLNVHDSVSLAIVAVESQPAHHEPRADQRVDELTELRHDVIHLRAALHTRLTLTRAVGLIQGRYGIADPETALRLLNDTAFGRNVPAYHLARILLATPAPADPGGLWFPGRRRRPEPQITFSPRPPADHGNFTATLDTFLTTALTYLSAETGALHLAEPPDDTLWLSHHQGLPGYLAHHVTDAQVAHAAATIAQARRKQLVVREVATDPVIPAENRKLLLEAGVHALHSTPMLTTARRCVGTVTVYHTDPGHAPDRLRRAKLDLAATELADWLEWHENTVIPDALEHLHNQAGTTG